MKKGAVKVKDGVADVADGFDVRVPGTNWHFTSEGAWERGKRRMGKVGGFIKNGAVKAGSGIKKGAKWTSDTAQKSKIVKGIVR